MNSLHRVRIHSITSETIRIPQGEQLEYVHMGFGSVYEQDLMIRIEKGVVVERALIDNREELQKLSGKEREAESDKRGGREIFNVHAWGGRVVDKEYLDIPNWLKKD